jgi:hypothetical protein
MSNVKLKVTVELEGDAAAIERAAEILHALMSANKAIEHKPTQFPDTAPATSIPGDRHSFRRKINGHY